MSIFDLFKRPKKKQPDLNQYFETISGYSPVFTSFDGGVFEARLTRSAINAVATAFSKVKAEVICQDENLKKQIESVLESPNEFQTTSQFMYRLAVVLLCETTAFIIPALDERGNITQLVVSIPASVTAVEDHSGELWLEFLFRNGERVFIEAKYVGIMRQFQYKNDIYGDGNKPIMPTIDLSHAQDESLHNQIVESADIRWIGRVGQQTSPEDLTKKRTEFSAQNLSKENKSGILLYDPTFSEVKQIEYNGKSIDADQMEQIENSVYNYFGVNEDILQNKFDEDTWGAFYEGRIEPLALQGSEVFSHMFFDKKKRSESKIMLTSNRLQYASNSTKIKVTQLVVDRGMLSLEKALIDIWNMNADDDTGTKVIRGEYIDMNNLGEHTLEEALSSSRSTKDASED